MIDLKSLDNNINKALKNQSQDNFDKYVDREEKLNGGIESVMNIRFDEMDDISKKAFESWKTKPKEK